MVIGILNAIFNDLSEQQQKSVRVVNVVLGFLVAGLKSYEKNLKNVKELNSLKKSNEPKAGELKGDVKLGEIPNP